MSNKFDDVKVGDKLMKKVACGVKGWEGWRFLKYFYVEVKVEKVTKTQFTADGVRYKKSGCKIGENYAPSIFRGGDKVSCMSQDLVPTKCQKKEMEIHKEKIDKVHGEFEINPIGCKNLDDAIKVSNLINQIQKIVQN